MPTRAFNGGVAADRITVSAGGATQAQGPVTIAGLVKITSGFSGTGWMLNGDDGSFVKFGLLVSGGPLFYENDFGGGLTPPTGVWVWIVGSKAAGASIPRWHVQNVTSGGAWSHANGASTVNDLSGNATEMIIGGQSFAGSGTTWRGSIAVLAKWASVLTDLQVQSACTLLASDLLAATPSWMVRLNQASTATAVTDDTGGGGNQTAISGTSVDSDVPPGFDFSLTPPPSGATPTGQAVPVALGSHTVSPLGASPTGQAIPVALGAHTVALGRTAAPTGQAIPVALGQPAVAIPSAFPTGLAIPVATGQPAVALARLAIPAGLAIPVALGQPSTLAPVATDSPNRPILATPGRKTIVAAAGGQPIVVSTHARAVAP